MPRRPFWTPLTDWGKCPTSPQFQHSPPCLAKPFPAHKLEVPPAFLHQHPWHRTQILSRAASCCLMLPRIQPSTRLDLSSHQANSFRVLNTETNCLDILASRYPCQGTGRLTVRIPVRSFQHELTYGESHRVKTSSADIPFPLIHLLLHPSTPRPRALKNPELEVQ